MVITHLHIPPVGIRLSKDVLNRSGRIRARIRWTDPVSHRRRSYSVTVDDLGKANDFFERMEAPDRTTMDPLISLHKYTEMIGTRYLRGLDPTSTASNYRGAINLRVLPALGHLPIRSITTGTIDRTIDTWEISCSSSTLKNTTAALTRVLDEAVRDELITTNPARTRARRQRQPARMVTVLEIPSLATVVKLADLCRAAHAAYGDFVLLCALLAARSSEVAGLLVGDIDWDQKCVTISRQHFPGAGGLCVKPTKARRVRIVPILKPLEATLRQLTDNRDPGEPLLRGPREGVVTTGALRHATNWDSLVTALGHPGLRRHDLRHAGATWFANAGVPLHIVSDVLGHASLETTKTYLHSSRTELTRAAAEVDRYLAQELTIA
jgi:integrase